MSVVMHPAQQKRLLAELDQLLGDVAILPEMLAEQDMAGLVSMAREFNVPVERARPIILKFYIDMTQARIEELGELLSCADASNAEGTD